MQSQKRNIITGQIPPALIACFGNDLVGDDSVGFHVYNRLDHYELPGQARRILMGAGGVALLDTLQQEEILLVVDSVFLGAAPGTVHELEGDEIPRLSGQAVSSHGIGLAEVIDIGKKLFPENMPKKIILLGIEGRNFDSFTECSDVVFGAVDNVCERIIELVGQQAK